jgi:TetR/AcrR family transcriptional repressor of multidrug resistance operon
LYRTNIRSVTKKEKILETTLKLIAKNGLSGSPMSMIAKEADVATGTIYHHFKSKEEIINEIYLNKKKDFKRILDKYEDDKLSVKKEFNGIWTDFYHYFIENPLIFTFTQQISFSPIITLEVKNEGETYYQSIFIFFKEGIDKGVFIDMDITLMTQLIFGNIVSLVELKLGGLDVTQKILKAAIKYSWRAVKK